MSSDLILTAWTKRKQQRDHAYRPYAGYYDPIGLLAPVTVSAKIILRKIWAHQPKLDWDDPLPTELQKEWSSFRESLSYVKS